MQSVFRQLDTAAPKKEVIPGAPTKEELDQAEGIEVEILEAQFSHFDIYPAASTTY